MNWNTFGQSLKAMLGLSTDADIPPEELLGKLEQLVNASKATLLDEAALEGLQDQLGTLSGEIEGLTTALANHKGNIEDMSDDIINTNARIDEIAKAKIVKSVATDSHNILSVNRDKVVQEEKADDDGPREIYVDTDIMLKAKNNTPWPKL